MAGGVSASSYAWADVNEGRTCEFSARAEFEQQADAMFLKLLERHGTSHEAPLAEHERHLQAQTLARNSQGRGEFRKADEFHKFR